MRFAETLKEARERAGLTQWKLAERAGLSRPELCRLEHGERFPSRGTVLRLGRALGLEGDGLRDFGKLAGFWFFDEEV